jgi:predicted site-specific integrase-resolvase
MILDLRAAWRATEDRAGIGPKTISEGMCSYFVLLGIPFRVVFLRHQLSGKSCLKTVDLIRYSFQISLRTVLRHFLELGSALGYARVSSLSQDLSIQLDALTAAGCTVVRFEKVTGTRIDGREEPATLLQFLREGDTLVVTRIDRLARSLRDLQNIVHDLRQRGVTLKAIEQQPIDTTTGAGECFLDMLGIFAEFETNLRRERQIEGIARAKAKGIYAGSAGPSR